MQTILLILAFVATYTLGVVTPKGLAKLAEWYLSRTAVKATSTTSETSKTK